MNSERLNWGILSVLFFIQIAVHAQEADLFGSIRAEVEVDESL